MKPTCIPEKLYESQKDVFDAVIAEVIEACAKVCNEGVSAYVHSDYTKGLAHGARLCAAAIRARSEK